MWRKKNEDDAWVWSVWSHVVLLYWFSRYPWYWRPLEVPTMWSRIHRITWSKSSRCHRCGYDYCGCWRWANRFARSVCVLCFYVNVAWMRRKSPGLNLRERSESPVTNISLVWTALGYIADLVAVTTVTSMLATLVRGLKPHNSYTSSVTTF